MSSTVTNKVHRKNSDRVARRGGKRSLNAAKLHRIRRASKMMDSHFRIPGTGIKFGMDSLVGLIPGIGDVATAVVPIWIIYEAHRAGVSRWTMARMVGNVVVDTVGGLVPVLGDVFDVYWKANLKNLRLLEKELGD